MRELYQHKPVFVIAEQWTDTYRPPEVYTKDDPEWRDNYEDCFGHRIALSDTDGWVPSAMSKARLGDWIVCDREARISVVKDFEFRRLYDAVDTARTYESGKAKT